MPMFTNELKPSRVFIFELEKNANDHGGLSSSLEVVSN